MTKPLTIACAKGYLWKKALAYLTNMGISFDNDLSESRQLSTIDTTGRVQLMKVRPWDVPVYLQEGAADVTNGWPKNGFNKKPNKNSLLKSSDLYIKRWIQIKGCL